MNLPDLLQQYKAFAIASAVIVFWVAGLVWPFAIGPKGQWPLAGQVRSIRLLQFKRLAKNISLAGLNALLSLAVVVPLTLWASKIGALAGGGASGWFSGFFAIAAGSNQWPGWLAGGLALLFDLLVLDLWIYVWHRANHKFAWLWRFHQVHHLDETLDASTALRFHFGEVLNASLVRAVVIVLLGIPLQSVLVFEVFVALSAIFHHSNLRLSAKLELVLSWFIVTPSIHWVHHHARRFDTDSNYATVLSVWDRLFKSRSSTVRTSDMPMGVEGARDAGLVGLIVLPLLGETSELPKAASL